MPTSGEAVVEDGEGDEDGVECGEDHQQLVERVPRLLPVQHRQENSKYKFTVVYFYDILHSIFKNLNSCYE